VEYFTAVCDILLLFGTLYQEKSGNPGRSSKCRAFLASLGSLGVNYYFFLSRIEKKGISRFRPFGIDFLTGGRLSLCLFSLLIEKDEFIVDNI
jgi:hypothetical protein